MSEKFSLLSQTLIALVLLGLCFFVFKELSVPVANYSASCTIQGLDRLEPKDITFKLEKATINNKSFLQINPIKIAHMMENHPLIAEAKIKRSLIPHKHLKIFIKEAKLWAVYGNKVLDQNAKFIFRFGKPRVNPRVLSLVQEIQDSLTQIQSYYLLHKDEIKIIHQNSKAIEKLLGDKVLAVIGEEDREFIFHTTNYRIKVGKLNSDCVKRVSRLGLITEKLKENQAELLQKLDYIDLSLESPEIILGKKI